MSPLDVYSRRGCHLCEALIDELLPMVRGRFDVRVHDIDSRPDWRDAYNERVPVVEHDGQTICEFRLDREAIGRLLELPPDAARN